MLFSAIDNQQQIKVKAAESSPPMLPDLKNCTIGSKSIPHPQVSTQQFTPVHYRFGSVTLLLSQLSVLYLFTPPAQGLFTSN